MPSPSCAPADLSPLYLLLLGCGRVGMELLDLLAARRDWLAAELRLQPLISGIATRSYGYLLHPRGLEPGGFASAEELLDELKQTGARAADVEEFILQGRAAGASALIELTTLNPHNGEPALTHISTALQAGLHVVTANKGPLAYAQPELQALARQRQVQLRFEATVIDGLPLINLAQFTLPGVGLHAFRAVLNATSSIVLSGIEQGLQMTEAIEQARRLGIAEADPWYDLDGWDAVMKTTILANNLLDGRLTPVMVEREGIGEIPPAEIRAAAAAGTPIRLLSQAYRQGELVVAQVRPSKLADNDILRYAQGATSVISLQTEAMGTLSLVEHAHEPAVLQTAYGIFSDLVTILLQRRASTPHVAQ
jgi:homoserine dehydrogenase